MKKELTLLVLLFSVLLNSAFSQLKYSGQIFSKPLYLNAAYSGSDKAPRLVYSYQSRSVMEQLTIRQTYASFDIGIKASGIGIEYMHIHEPMWITQTIKVSYAHEFKVGNVNLRPALSAGLVASNFDDDDYTPYIVDQFTNDTFFFEKPSPVTVFSAGAGVIAKYKGLTVGLYADQINKPVLKYFESNNQKLYPQILAHADYRFKIGKSVDIIPGFVYFYNNYHGREYGSSYYQPVLNLRIGVVELGYSPMFSDNFYDATSLSGGLVWKYFRLKYSYARETHTDVHNWKGSQHEITFSASLKKE